MTAQEAGAMLHLHPPFTVEKVEDAYDRAMRALNSAYGSSSIGAKLDAIDDEKRMAGEARKVLMGCTRRPPPPRPSTPFRPSQPLSPTVPWRRLTAGMGPFAIALHRLAEKLLLGLFDIAQMLYKGIATLSPEGKKVLAAIALVLAVPALSRFAGYPGPGIAEVKILSYPKSDVYVNGIFLAGAPFVHPARVSVKDEVAFRFQNPGYPAVERTLTLKRDRRYIIRVDFEDNACQVEEVSRWGRQ